MTLLPLSNAEYSAVYDGVVLKVSVSGNTDGAVLVSSLDRVPWVGALKYALTGHYGGVPPIPPTKQITEDNIEHMILPNRAVNSRIVLVETANSTTEVEIHYTGFKPPQPEDLGPQSEQSVLPPIRKFLVGGKPGTHTCEISAFIPPGDWEVTVGYNQEMLMIWNTVASAKKVQWYLTWLKEPPNPNRPIDFIVTTSPELHAQSNNQMIGTVQVYQVQLVFESQQ